jgi:type III pantothenate kinase
MILLLDIGNSRLKWAMAEDGRLQTAQSEPHQGDPAKLFYSLALPQVKQVWVSQVMGPQHEQKLTEVLQSHYGFAPHIARTQAELLGLHCGYAEPERLGVDRWLAMLALWTQTQHGFCVVNAGTALTFDSVDEGGQHLGGLIAPGLVTSEKAVLDATRFATRPQAPRYSAGLGRDTESCVRQGALHACTGLIERAARQSIGGRFISGGDAAALLPHMGGGWDWRPNLVLEGLLALARNEPAE